MKSFLLRRVVPLLLLGGLTLGSCTVHEHRDYGRRGRGSHGRDHRDHRDYGYYHDRF